jgi:hypothetical protein
MCQPTVVCEGTGKTFAGPRSFRLRQERADVDHSTFTRHRYDVGGIGRVVDEAESAPNLRNMARSGELEG